MNIKPHYVMILYAVQAVPLSKRIELDDQACIDSIPPQADPGTVDAVYRALVDRGANMIVMQATFETCLQESRCNNLPCGDQDSVGAFQQRPSMGWCPEDPQLCQDPYYAAGKFLDGAIPAAAENPGFTPDQIAQTVQKAELGNLYAQRFDWANQLIAEAQARAGGGSTPSSPQTSPSGGDGTTSDQTGGCTSVIAAPGDSCWAIATAQGIDVGTFLSKNPSIDAACSNLQAGVAYCV
ncbi:hypothetical protein BKA62DRAFT_833915 [Auriculariales sp. MPI-PUGE-AT-0066]|nr:hypothetical protein BKA62DRAFT_833915 [Auriculariales sp. MPI-PUGE-AT-0066]